MIRNLVFAALAGAGPAAAGDCPVTLTDVAPEVGLRFVHDRGRTEAHHLPETMGSGLAWLDYDNDGWMDLYVVQSGRFPTGAAAAGAGAGASRGRLFHNEHGRFVDVTDKAGLRDTGYGMGAWAADYDNDGFVDLFVTQWGRNTLWHNNGDGTFRDVTERAGVGMSGWSTAAAWADFDGDGRLDLYVARYVDDAREKDAFCGDMRTGQRDYCPPMMYPGTSGVLFRNRGDGTFADVTARAGLDGKIGKGLGVLFVDLDGDLRPDIYVANDEQINFLFHNAGEMRFEDESVSSGTGFSPEGNPQGSMGVDAGDLDGDGRPDLGVTNYENETNGFYRNLGERVYEDVSVPSGFGSLARRAVGFGLNFLDLENDGDLDVFVANGHTQERPRRQGMTYAQRPTLLWNDGKGHFTERPCGPAFDTALVGRGSAVADFDNDGDLDIAVSNSGGPIQLLRNDGAHGNWLGVALVGTKSNRQGIGARIVAVTADGKRQTRWLLAGSSYLSTSDPRALFGLGGEKSVRTLTVYWPSGTVQTLADVPAGSYVTVTEK
ncbi:MAG TPA: CRTAC1 family protein [Thermoanaerobaculia bacterium]|nr:CRTAC1 family protein [Thermoanaerobaculia bacterium]